MTDYDAIKEAPLAFLDYFVDWGAKPWSKFVETSIRYFLGEDLSGKRLLEIGPGRGKISCLMSLLGAEVTALETEEYRLEQARATASEFDLNSKIEFIHYDGNLDVLNGQVFDIVFTKSVLVHIGALDAFLRKINDHLDSSGKVVFIENARGGGLIHILRWIKRRRKSFFDRFHFFTEKEVDLVKSIFNIELLMHSKLPPVYLFCGKKK
jgi:protein-L-isoaspartate O-methyltransferase